MYRKVHDCYAKAHKVGRTSHLVRAWTLAVRSSRKIYRDEQPR